jgi:hypothetical protein
MTTQRTPGPWVVSFWVVSGQVFDGIRALTNDGGVPIMSDSGRICAVDAKSNPKRGKGHQHECAERDANAAYIVEACNNYERVCEELKKLAEFVTNTHTHTHTQELDAMTPENRFDIRSRVMHKFTDDYAAKIGLGEWDRAYLCCDIGVALGYGTPIMQAIKAIKRAADTICCSSVKV